MSSPTIQCLLIKFMLHTFSNILLFLSEIAAHAEELQSRSRAVVDISEIDRIGFGESGIFDADIYDQNKKEQSRYDGYVTSIAANDEVDEEDYDGATAPSNGGRQSITAPAAILNEMVGEDFDPFAEHRRPTIADREDEYRAKRRKMVISPERVDPFAEGKKIQHL